MEGHAPSQLWNPAESGAGVQAPAVTQYVLCPGGGHRPECGQVAQVAQWTTPSSQPHPVVCAMWSRQAFSWQVALHGVQGICARV